MIQFMVSCSIKRLLTLVFSLLETISVSSQCNNLDVTSPKGNTTEFAIGSFHDGIIPPEKDTLSLMVEKQRDVLYVYVPLDTKRCSYVCYPLKHRVLRYSENVYPSFLDNWGIMQPYSTKYFQGIMECVNVLFNTGESELSVSLPSGEMDVNRYIYVGGCAHGFENIVSTTEGRRFFISIDDEEVLEDSSFELHKCSKIEVFQESELVQAYTNTNPWSIATKKWCFSKNGVTITTRLTILRELPLLNAMFGMFCVYRHVDGDDSMPYLTSRAFKDNDSLNVYNIEDGWEISSENVALQFKDSNCRMITLYGDTDYEFSINISDATIKSNGGMCMGTNRLGYNKVYFDLTGVYQPNVGEILEAKQTWSIISHSIDSDNTTTGVSTTPYISAPEHQDYYFDINGRKIRKGRFSRGFYIHNGKKYVYH